MQRMLVVPGPLTTAQWIATVAGTANHRASTAAIEHDALTGGSYVLNVWYCIHVALTPYHCSPANTDVQQVWLIFPLAMWHCWHTCWNTQCLLQLGVPHKVLDCIRASISTAKAFTTFCSDCQLWAAFTNNLDGRIMQVWVEKATQRTFVSSVRRWSYHHAYTLH
jgi:hypothetical protein